MKACLLLVCLFAVALGEFKPRTHHQGSHKHYNYPGVRDETYEQSWGYVEVRPGAHSFYWLFYTNHEDGWQNRPIIIWLQGGPGSSSTGYGNFEIIGPRDYEGEYRNTTWVRQANVLFIDNPVGTGYSYVEDLDLLTTDTQEIAEDLYTLWAEFLNTHPEFTTTPLYIFGQSYGGKMGTVFAQELHKHIEAEDVDTNLGGWAMGNAWIEPVQSTINWGGLLYWMSNTDEQGAIAIDAQSQKVVDAVEAGDWEEATTQWVLTEYEVWRYTNFVDFYNILKYTGPGTKGTTTYPSFMADDAPHEVKMSMRNPKMRRQLQERKDVSDELKKILSMPLESRLTTEDEFMNGELKNYLGIPEEVVHGGQSNDVFGAHSEDFMKPVFQNVEWMLNHTNRDCIVYQGQLDLICLNKAANDWVRMMYWEGIDDYLTADRNALVDPWTGQTDTFVKANGKFKFYWNLLAGHAVPKDASEGAFRMLDRIINQVDV